MIDLEDTANLEGEAQSEEDYFRSLQRFINGGEWSWPGHVGRQMMAAIEDGRCLLGRVGFRDAYGNCVPSRAQVQDGTKGSLSFVAARHGQEWADFIAAIE